MDREFRKLYERELNILQEQAKEFSEEYPGIADRLGGLVRERQDPMITGLLQGAAFLAARVQLKLQHEFSEFTNNLLEQLVPHYLAPTPSALLARVTPHYGDPALRDGGVIARGSYIDATYRERDRRVSCRYRLTSAITLWPFDIVGAQYLASPGPLQALGLPVGRDVQAGLRLSLTHRTAPTLDEETPEEADPAKAAEAWFAGCRMTELPVYLLGSEADATALSEQLFAQGLGVYFRRLDQFGDPVVTAAPPDCLQPVGFGEAEALMPSDKRIFRGFDLLREYFLFPRKFLGFRLTRLGGLMPQLASRTVDVIITFKESNQRMSAAVGPEMFSLYTAPAINLFEKTTDRIAVKSNQHEYQVVADRSRYLDYEPHRVLNVYAHISGGREKLPVQPLYSAPPESETMQPGLFYTLRRLPRRRSGEERRYGTPSDYMGTDVFLSLAEPAALEEAGVSQLSVKALCSNRHLPEHLPVGEAGADFRLLDDVTLDVRCAAGPTPPRGPVVGPQQSRAESNSTGVVTWRLINMLSLNHLGLVEHGAGKGGQSLREILSLFADLTDSATEARIRGVRSIESRPVVRRLRQRSGIGVARGIEVTVTLEDKAFEGSGVYLLGAILDQFFSEYAALNHFTQTALRTVERGEIMRWPPRMGARRSL